MIMMAHPSFYLFIAFPCWHPSWHPNHIPARSLIIICIRLNPFFCVRGCVCVLSLCWVSVFWALVFLTLFTPPYFCVYNICSEAHTHIKNDGQKVRGWMDVYNGNPETRTHVQHAHTHVHYSNVHDISIHLFISLSLCWDPSVYQSSLV